MLPGDAGTLVSFGCPEDDRSEKPQHAGIVGSLSENVGREILNRCGCTEDNGVRMLPCAVIVRVMGEYDRLCRAACGSGVTSSIVPRDQSFPFKLSPQVHTFAGWITFWAMGCFCTYVFIREIKMTCMMCLPSGWYMEVPGRQFISPFPECSELLVQKKWPCGKGKRHTGSSGTALAVM